MPPVRGLEVRLLACARNGTRAIACSSVSAMYSSASTARVSATGHLVAFDRAIDEVDQAAAQPAFAVLAAGVDAGGAADLHDALRFVDVTVQAEHGLIFLDGLADGRAASAGEHDLPA